MELPSHSEPELRLAPTQKAALHNIFVRGSEPCSRGLTELSMPVWTSGGLCNQLRQSVANSPVIIASILVDQHKLIGFIPSASQLCDVDQFRLREVRCLIS